MKNNIYRGKVYLADLTPTIGCEQGRIRPVLIIQNDIGNKHSPTVIVAAISSKYKNKHLIPTHVRISAKRRLSKDSTVLLEQIRVIDKIRIISYLCELNELEMKQVDFKIQISLGLCTSR